MKKPLEKVALIAHVCISFVFVLLTVLILFNVLPLNYLEGALVVDSIVLVLIGVLAFFYVALTAYLINNVLNQNQLLKYVELYRDATATVMATSKTIKKMVVENANQAGNVKVSKVRIANDGKYGLILKLWVSVSSQEVSYLLDTLRCMCEDSFDQVLGLRFSGIDFKVEKISGNYQPDLERAQQQAKTLEAERNLARECYQDPLCEDCQQAVTDCSQCNDTPDKDGKQPSPPQETQQQPSNKPQQDATEEQTSAE